MIKLKNAAVKERLTNGTAAAAAASLLGVPAERIESAEILRCSVDARKKSDVHYVYTLAVSAKNEAAILSKGRAEPYTPPERYSFPYAGARGAERPVVVGMGPAGLFAALCLAEAGLPPIVLERGRPVERRSADVARFWETGELDPNSNVQFGEGGAGTFSDGKLNTGVSDPRMRYIMERFVEFGATEDILYLAKPHMGTDKLRTVVAAMRRRLVSLGCDVRFESRLCGLAITGGALRSIMVERAGETGELKCGSLILAPGNGARDTFKMLYDCGVSMSAKNFSVGVRIEHRQAALDASQYGEAATLGTLPASGYKLAVHLEGGRSVYTFCVCPGGSVVAASSEAGGVVTNGMSEYARDAENCCGGLLVSVTPEDYPGSPLAGVEFQRELERSAYRAGGQDYRAPAQLVGDFLKKRPSRSAGAVAPSYRPGVSFCNLWDVLPDFVCQALAEALPLMERKVRGFASPDAVLTAVETRSSCPLRLERDGGLQAVGVAGLYPCGEGAGYAGGIMSAAADGIRAAEALCGRSV